MKYVCDACGYVYDETVGDPEHGIAPGTKWEDVPEDFECPLCGVGKDMFSKEQRGRGGWMCPAAPFCYIPAEFLIHRCIYKTFVLKYKYQCNAV